MRFGAARVVLVCLALFPTAAHAVTYTLERQHLPTTVEGVAVDLYVSGPVDIDPALDHLTGVFDVTIDLSDFQDKFKRILDARAAAVPCGRRALVISNGALAPVSTTNGVAAEITGRASYVTRACKGASSSDPLATVRVHVTPTVQGETIAFNVAPVGAARAAQDEIRDAILSAFGSVTQPSTVVAPLSPDTQALEPRVLSASFVTVSDGRLGAKLRVELTLTAALVLDWLGGGR